MFLILKLIYNACKQFDEEHRDPRTEDYPIMSSPMHMWLLAILYYVFVKHLGPKIMEKREAFELKNVILVYNLLQVVFNLYLVIGAMYAIFWKFSNYSIICAMPRKDYSPEGLVELHLCYFYFVLKIFDYMDTVFMVLRKRSHQVSFLHVYHHIVISLGCFGGMRYLPGGHSALLGIINAMVHSIMYSYYFISALRPELKNSLWWKKHITQAQMLQFLILTVHFTRPLVQKNCDYPMAPSMIGLVQSVVMLVLFSDFYRRAYMKKPKKELIE